MQNLIEFFIRRRAFFIYLFYALISFVLLIRFNPYHQSVFFSSSNQTVGGIYNWASNVTNYFGLKEINQDLLHRNGELALEVRRLKEQIMEQENATEVAQDVDTKYDFVVAQVINNQVTQMENYITLNKGAVDGIRPHMGVVDQNGVVGIVSLVSDHYSVVISVLNTDLRLSAKVVRSDYFGSVQWDGMDPQEVIIDELPRHMEYALGDTIVTSGYSAALPEGIPIGVITGTTAQHDDNFYAFKVKLATDFFRLNDVRVIVNNEQDEQHQLENQARKK